MADSEKLTLRTDLQPGETVEFEFEQHHVQHECLADGRARGVERLTIWQAGASVSFLLTRGLSIECFTHNDYRFGWESPIRGPVHPHWVPMAEPSGLGWLDGFDELFVRCGLTSNGAPEFDEFHRLKFPLHGRIANLPANAVALGLEAATGQLVLSGEIWETRFHFHKWLLQVDYHVDLLNGTIRVVDRVTNYAGTPRDFQMLYHFNLGRPLLSPGAQIITPLSLVTPRDWHTAGSINQWSEIVPTAAGQPEDVFFCEPLADEHQRSLALLMNADRTRAAGIGYDVTQLPCFSIWKNLASAADGFVIGLEPATNYPNIRSFEAQHRRTVLLEPQQSWETSVDLWFAADSTSARRLQDQVERIQSGRPKQLMPEPHPRWSAAKF